MKQEKKHEKKRNKITYWDEIELEKKAIKARLEVEGATEEPIKEIVNLYNKVEKDINKDIQKIYDTYGKRTKETTEKVDEYLTNAEKNKEDKYLLDKINNANSETERKELVNIYNAQSAMYRMSRLENIKNNISIKLIGLAGEEEKINKDHYTKILVNKDNKFSTLKLKIQDEGAFNTVTKHMIDEVLEKKWYAKNYSDRIWENKDKLQEALDEILNKGLIQGKSMQKMAREFNEITHAGLYNATRLIRTESAYYHGQVTLKEYDELGVTKYKFTAKLDHRTSKICRNHDDKVYLVSEAKVGVNYPPMHPHCRSTTVPIIEEENKENKFYDDVTEEELKNKENEGYTVYSKGVWKDDIYYETNSINKIKFRNNEKENGEWLAKVLGGIVEYLPELGNHQGIKCADYIYYKNKNDKKGIFIDNKEVAGKGKNSFYHACEGKEKQSNVFLIDCTKASLTLDDIKERIELVFRSRKTNFVEKLIIKQGSKLIGIYKKIK